ncbi:MAG: hypothetical protein IBJ11_03050 [Phycisphaerales bacterium]|nr:hypothetical protein [Phycisphaerales bacterium]
MLNRSVGVRAAMVVLAGAAVALGGCKGADKASSAPASEAAADRAAAAPAADMSAVPAADRALAPLAFMAGRWIGVNPNKTVNEEQWMAPRGTSMMGAFRQIRRDTKPAFFEVTIITVENGEVLLRQRHLHNQLQVPENRKEASVFKLTSVGGNSAEFTPSGDNSGVEAVVYRLVDRDTLATDVRFKPDTKEKNFTSIYKREPSR